MSDLLPPSSTVAERALADAIGRAGEVPVVIREIWNPDTCPASLLPWLAWAFSVDEWSPAWTELQKREVIKTSFDVHRHKGTVGAVQDALRSLFVGARVQEWFRQIPQGDPYTFRVLLEVDQYGIDQSAIGGLKDIINRTKNLRSHLDEIQVIATTQAGVSCAAVTILGSDIRLTNFQWATTVFNETTICL
jgi:phage tail P2-like protein